MSIDAAAILERARAKAGTETAPTSPNLPLEFWQARPVLAHVRQAAHCRGRSADAVLGVFLARVAALTPPSLLLPAIVGTAGTLDLVVALVGDSGAGKTSGAGVAAELLPIVDDDVAVIPVGSGEGIVDAYLGTVLEEDASGKKQRVRRQVHRAVLAELDEGQAMHEIGGRKGATLLPTIRSAWSGARLGQHNASEDRRRNLPPRSYRFAMVAGFQYASAIPLLEDESGTAQRTVWVAAEDSTVPKDDAPTWPGPVHWRPPTHQAGEMAVAPEVHAAVRTAAIARTRGDVRVAALDAHRDLSRLKVAGLLAVLDGRTNITAEDWQLGGTVLDASDRLRATIQWRAADAAREAERAHTAKLIGRAAALEGSEAERALAGMARAIARHVHRGTCADGCKRRCATQATKSSHRRLATIDEALEEAQRYGWIVVAGDALTPGRAPP